MAGIPPGSRRLRNNLRPCYVAVAGNIAFLVGCFFLLVGQPKRARNAGLLATALALGLLLEVGFSPAGLGIGYLAWVASMALLTVAAGRAV